MKKACVFVDGENLRYSLLGCLVGHTNFQNHDYLPRKANWGTFFDWITKHATNDECYRLRTYWYAIEFVEFSPFNLEKLYGQELERILCRNKTIKDELQKRSTQLERTEFLEVEKAKLREKRLAFKDRFNGWQSIQNGIASRHKAVEFRRSGAIKYDLFKEELGEEKTVDVKLAIDALILEKTYDVAIIVSGDQDYVPVAQALKDRGKSVINVAFEKKNGNLLPGGAWRLNMASDWSFNIPYQELLTHMGCEAITRKT